MKRFFGNIIFAIYVVIAVFVTICLLSYNDYRVTELGDYSLVIIDGHAVEPEFNKGDLVIVDKYAKVNVEDDIFFYNNTSGQTEISVGKVVDIEEVTSVESTYTIEGDRKLSSQRVIGSAEDVKVYAGLGTLLGLLESKWGFLFIIVLPALLAFLWQIVVVYEDIRDAKKEVEKGR